MAAQLADLTERSRVICLATLASQLERALNARNLTVDTSRSLPDLRTRIPGDARAILVGYSVRLREALVTLTDIGWQQDLLIIVLVGSLDERLRADEVRLSVLSEDQAKYRRMLEEQRGLDVIDATAFDEIAEACARFRLGRQSDTSMGVHFQVPAATDSANELLLRRAFSTYSRITVHKLGGGYTDCEVFRVEAWDGSAQCAPFVAKVGPHRDIAEEVGTGNAFVADRVPFPNHPPIIHDRCISASTKSVLVSRLVDHAHRLDDYIGSSDPEQIARVVALLFGGAFRFWRAKPQSVRVGLFDRYRQIGIIPEVADVREAWSAALVDDPSIAEPEELFRRLSSAAPQENRECLSHGDLQVRNIFVRHHPFDHHDVIDVVAIDFAKAGTTTSAARDLAALEVSIVFDELRGLLRPTWGEIQPLYGSDFLFGEGVGAGPRLDWINAIRKQAARELIPAQELAFSLAAHLLRYSKFKPQPVDVRALAYRAAVLLLARNLAVT